MYLYIYRWYFTVFALIVAACIVVLRLCGSNDSVWFPFRSHEYWAGRVNNPQNTRRAHVARASEKVNLFRLSCGSDNGDGHHSSIWCDVCISFPYSLHIERERECAHPRESSTLCALMMLCTPICLFAIYSNCLSLRLNTHTRLNCDAVFVWKCRYIVVLLFFSVVSSFLQYWLISVNGWGVW